MKRISTVIVLVALIAAVCALEYEDASVPGMSPDAAPMAEPESVPMGAPMHAPVAAAPMAPGSGGSIPFAVYASDDCSGTPVFTSTFVDDYTMCQAASILTLRIQCVAQMIHGEAFQGPNCSGPSSLYPDAASGVCTLLPQGSMGRAIRGYCPGAPTATPAAAPTAAPSNSASSLFVSSTLVALALLALFVF